MAEVEQKITGAKTIKPVVAEVEETLFEREMRAEDDEVAFDREFWHLGRNEWPYRLWEAWYGGEIDDLELRRLILHAWGGAEWPSSLGQRVWIEMFRATGYVEEAEPIRALPKGEFAAYRGAAISRKRGFAWTLDRERADWFANRTAMFGFPGGVFEVKLTKDGLLAALLGKGGRNEEEVLVNPNRLRGRYSPRELNLIRPEEAR